jgi:Uma2 family endonuclease
MLVRIRHPEKLIYPESDGQPMGENTVQVKWIIELYNGLQAAFRDRDDVFIAADLFWYPIYGDPTNVLAPDLMVVVGRPKGDRPSYKQWEEENIPPQVVFEILSPGNTERDRAKKLRFYRRYGVEEFYEYDPDIHNLLIWRRRGRKLAPVEEVNGFVSPRLRLKFEVSGTEPMRVVGPDKKPFRSYLDLLADADAQQNRAFEERERAEAEKKRAEAEKKRAEALAARLRELGVDPDRIQ